MRIAAACDGLQIAPHFNRCSSYMCYTVDKGLVIDSRNIPASDQPLDQLADFFHAIEADVLLCGTIEDDLAENFEEQGVHVVGNMAGEPLPAIRALLIQQQ